MSIKYNERGEVISVNGLTTGHHIGMPMQDGAAQNPDDNLPYFEERNTKHYGNDANDNKQPSPVGGGADWNQNDPSAPDYVMSRTHYDIPDGTWHVEEQTVTIGEDLYCELVGRGDLVEETDYRVMFNGEEYWLTAKYGAEWECVYLGNAGLVEDGEDDGFPFAIDAYPDDGCNIYLDVKEPGEYTISVESTQYAFKKLSAKYLPNSIGGGGADLVIRAIMDGSNNVASSDIAFGSYDAVIEKLQAMQPPIVHVIMMKDDYAEYNDSHFYTTKPISDLSTSWGTDRDVIEVYGNKGSDLFYVYPDGSVEYNYVG